MGLLYSDGFGVRTMTKETWVVRAGRGAVRRDNRGQTPIRDALKITNNIDFYRYEIGCRLIKGLLLENTRVKTNK